MPKDVFPLPIVDIIINNMCSFKRMSFMDSFSGYNQKKMCPNNEKHTSFWIPHGIYCNTVMPFRLENAGATYQWAMTVGFFAVIYERLWNAILMTLQSKARIKMTRQRLVDNIQLDGSPLIENKSDQVLHRSFKWEIS